MKLIRDPIVEQVPLRGPVSVAVREFSLPAFRYPWHRHPEVELTWILEGSGLRYVGDSVEPFQAGDLCLLGGNLPHAWLSDASSGRTKARSLVVQFDPAKLRGALASLPEFAGIGRLLDRSAHGLWFRLRPGSRHQPERLRHRSALFRFTALLEILDELARDRGARSLSRTTSSGGGRIESDRRLRRVLAHLTENIGEAVSQAEYARLAGLSPTAFSRFFGRTMDRTFQSYVTELRLNIVCRQLLETDQPISEIAFAAGFANLSNFNRSFLMRLGMAPRRFRKEAYSRR